MWSDNTEKIDLTFSQLASSAWLKRVIVSSLLSLIPCKFPTGDREVSLIVCAQENCVCIVCYSSNQEIRMLGFRNKQTEWWTRTKMVTKRTDTTMRKGKEQADKRAMGEDGCWPTQKIEEETY